MKLSIGTRSLLFGVHNIIWHPYTVYRAWEYLYAQKPTLRETACIFFHDWGYVGSPSMDGEFGMDHPFRSASLVANLPFMGKDEINLVMWHSRHLAAKYRRTPSMLCWADKASILFDPKWFYLLRARLSGEIIEYRLNATKYVPLSARDDEWYDFIFEHFQHIAENQLATERMQGRS